MAQKVNLWIDKGKIPSSIPSATLLIPKHKGSVSYIDTIESQHPGYVRSLFRYAQRIHGPLSMFLELSTTMNNKAKINPTCPSTTTSQRQLNKWFIRQGGKEFAPTTKPLDTLDKKWVYTTNRRRRVKKLPRLLEEEEGSDFTRSPKWDPAASLLKQHLRGCRSVNQI